MQKLEPGRLYSHLRSWWQYQGVERVEVKVVRGVVTGELVVLLEAKGMIAASRMGSRQATAALYCLISSDLCRSSQKSSTSKESPLLATNRHPSSTVNSEQSHNNAHKEADKRRDPE